MVLQQSLLKRKHVCKAFPVGDLPGEANVLGAPSMASNEVTGQILKEIEIDTDTEREIGRERQGGGLEIERGRWDRTTSRSFQHDTLL